MRPVVKLVAGLLTVAAVLAACGGEIDHPTSAPTAAPETARAEAQDRDFVLVLESASERWLASDDIEVSATLTYVGEGTGTDYWASGQGPIAFGVREIGGTREMGAVRTMDCVPYQIAADHPLTVPYRKSGGIDPGEPNEPFYQSFFADPAFQLPAGRWEITADLALVLSPGCGEGREVRLQAALTIVVE
jgi:hypothetical protein